MGPLSRLIKKIFGKKEEPKKEQPTAHQTKQVADAVKKADAGEFASPAEVAKIKEKWSEPTLKEKVDIEYAEASAQVKAATPVAKAVPAYQGSKKSSSYHRDDDDDSFVRNSFYSASASTAFGDSYSSSDSSSSCSSDSYSSSCDSSSSSSCDSSSW